MTVLALPSLPTTCWASTGKVSHFAPMPVPNKPLWTRRSISTVRWPGRTRARRPSPRSVVSDCVLVGMNRKGNAPAASRSSARHGGSIARNKPRKIDRRAGARRNGDGRGRSGRQRRTSWRGWHDIRGSHAIAPGDVVELLLRFKGGERSRHQPDLGARLIGPHRTVWIQSEARNLIGRCAKPRPVWLGSALEDVLGPVDRSHQGYDAASAAGGALSGAG